MLREILVALACLILSNLDLLFQPPLQQTRTSTLQPKFAPKRMAVVLPFIRQDAQDLIQNIRRWTADSNLVSACRNPSLYATNIDFVLYFHKPFETLPAKDLDQLKLLLEHAELSSCYNKLRYISADLNDTEDSYPAGPSNMFFKLFQLSHIQKTYDTIYWMEPDQRPCQQYWLDSIYEQVLYDAEFWFKGSILRNAKHVSDEIYSTYTFAEHINGNGWYRIGSPDFVAFMKTVESEYRKYPEKYLSSWDIAIDLIRRDRALFKWQDFAATFHRFKYTHVIQNVYRAHVNISELCSRDKETFLVHGRNLSR